MLWRLLSVMGLAILLTRCWYAWPDAFPTWLMHAGNRLIDHLGIDEAEVAADIERLYVFMVSLPPSLLIEWAARKAWRHRRSWWPRGTAPH